MTDSKKPLERSPEVEQALAELMELLEVSTPEEALQISLELARRSNRIPATEDTAARLMRAAVHITH